jgi:hypothetical protein
VARVPATDAGALGREGPGGERRPRSPSSPTTRCSPGSGPSPPAAPWRRRLRRRRRRRRPAAASRAGGPGPPPTAAAGRAGSPSCRPRGPAPAARPSLSPGPRSAAARRLPSAAGGEGGRGLCAAVAAAAAAAAGTDVSQAGRRQGRRDPSAAMPRPRRGSGPGTQTDLGAVDPGALGDPGNPHSPRPSETLGTNTDPGTLGSPRTRPDTLGVHRPSTPQSSWRSPPGDQDTRTDAQDAKPRPRQPEDPSQSTGPTWPPPGPSLCRPGARM